MMQSMARILKRSSFKRLLLFDYFCIVDNNREERTVCIGEYEQFFDAKKTAGPFQLNMCEQENVK